MEREELRKESLVFRFGHAEEFVEECMVDILDAEDINPDNALELGRNLTLAFLNYARLGE